VFAANLWPLPSSGNDPRRALETTKIHSAMGLAHGLIDVRPFRAPQHMLSTAALIGGGLDPGGETRPGRDPTGVSFGALAPRSMTRP
jgi:predicted ATPase with chaperone activity